MSLFKKLFGKKDTANNEPISEENIETSLQEIEADKQEETEEEEETSCQDQTTAEAPIETEEKDVISVEENNEEEKSNEEEKNNEEEEEATLPQKQGFIKRLFSGLSKTRDQILKGVDDVLSNFRHMDEDLYEE